MLTFLELYQTLLGFVFFKLYTDASLVYPPPLDSDKDDTGAGIGAYVLKEIEGASVEMEGQNIEKSQGNKISGRNVRQTIKVISTNALEEQDDLSQKMDPELDAEVEEDFVTQPTGEEDAVALPTFKTLSSLPQTLKTSLFSPYTFYISREVSRPLFEFMVRSFGGRVGWPLSSGSGSPFDESDNSITHVIIDRPSSGSTNEASEAGERRLRRKFVQPQWIADCINAGKILFEDPYAPGKMLPPHLSPFTTETDQREGAVTEMAINSNDIPEDGVTDLEVSKDTAQEDNVTKEQKNMNKMMMSRKQRKLYDKLKRGQDKRMGERMKLEHRREALKKANSVIHSS